MATPDIVPVNDLRRSWMATSPQVVEAVRRVVASGSYVQGPEHDAFEAEFATFLGVRHVAGVANGTDALVLAMQALGCTTGSEIVTVANAGGYAASAAAQVAVPGPAPTSSRLFGAKSGLTSTSAFRLAVTAA